ncbi:MAG: hypothetical protein L6R41_000588 [Letrouitia leprolyta]|nr:MAG: hypothetical protein L6R41_000588 [Letrouitia leprolyta]
MPGTGWQSQPGDPNDWIYTPPPNLKTPPSVDLRKTHRLQKTAYDQGTLSSCTANAIASAILYGENAQVMKTHNPSINPSRMFIWYQERIMSATHGEWVDIKALAQYLNKRDANDPNNLGTLVTPSGKQIPGKDVEAHIKNDKGSWLRSGLKSLVKHGVCPEKAWPYEDPKKTKDPKKTEDPKESKDYPYYAAIPKDACSEAVKFFKFGFTYYRIKDQSEKAGPNLIAHMEAALTEKFPIIFGFRGSESQAPLPDRSDKHYVYDGWLTEAKDKEDVWGHAVLAVGYDKARKQFLILNSWGPKFGNQGYFWMPYRMFEEKDNMYKDWDGHKKYRVADFWIADATGRIQTRQLTEQTKAS